MKREREKVRSQRHFSSFLAKKKYFVAPTIFFQIFFMSGFFFSKKMRESFLRLSQFHFELRCVSLPPSLSSATMDSTLSLSQHTGGKRSVEEEEDVVEVKRVSCEEKLLVDGAVIEIGGPLVGDEEGEQQQQQQEEEKKREEEVVLSAAVLETLFFLAGQVVADDFSYSFDDAVRARRVSQALAEVLDIEARVASDRDGRPCIYLERSKGEAVYEGLKCASVEGMDVDEKEFVRKLAENSVFYVDLLVAVGKLCNQLVREKIGEHLCEKRKMFFDWSLALFTSFEGDGALRVPVLITSETIDLIKEVHSEGIGKMDLTGQSLSAALCNIWKDEIKFEQVVTDCDFDPTYEIMLGMKDCEYEVEMIVYSKNIRKHLLPVLEKDKKSRPLSDSSQTCTYFEFLGSMTNPCEENEKEFQLLEDFYYDDYV